MKGQRMVAASGTGSVSAPAASNPWALALTCLALFPLLRASWTPAPTAKVAAAYTGQPAQQVLPASQGAANSFCPPMPEAAQLTARNGVNSVTLPVKLSSDNSGSTHAGASLSTEATGRTCEEHSAASGCTQLATASDGSVAASAGDATVGALRSEIEGLRAELDVLRALLDEGLQQRQDAERSQNALISRVEQLSSGKLQAEQQMREAQSEMHWLRGELARCHRHARSEVQSLQGPLDEGHHLDNGTPDVEQPSLRHASWSPPKQPASSPPSPARHRARASPAHSVDVHCSPPNGSGMSRSSSYKGSSYEPAPHTDEVDEMWRTVLQRFPQHPQWCLVKEKRCVYRMGSQTGKKIVCRVTHGGLQVRVGGGWMAAFPFLERYGPLNMGQKGEDMQYNCTSVDLPPSMERLLVPTKSWAQRIGISKTPDLREQRRLQVDEEDASEAGRPRSMSKRAWSATAPAECLASIPQGLPALDGDGLAQALQPLPWPGHTRSRQTEECRKL
ncbi:unnamed protein product [Symbiodinium sp. KB8]|nr:unnamed protein product [Symbiodinium sp. KB8]